MKLENRRVFWHHTGVGFPVSRISMRQPRVNELPMVSEAACFATTHWSVVLMARDGLEAEAHDALSHLCTVYWYPLYAYLRRRGFAPPDAEDLTQSFLAYLLSKDFLTRVAPQRGKFR